MPDRVVVRFKELVQLVNSTSSILHTTHSNYKRSFKWRPWFHPRRLWLWWSKDNPWTLPFPLHSQVTLIGNHLWESTPEWEKFKGRIYTQSFLTQMAWVLNNVYSLIQYIGPHIYMLGTECTETKQIMSSPLELISWRKGRQQINN